MDYTPEETALAKAVIANPDDDLPKLVFADKLEDNFSLGGGRAERAVFIRLQIAQKKGRVCLNCRLGDSRGCFVPECPNNLDKSAKGILHANRFEELGSAYEFTGPPDTDREYRGAREVWWNGGFVTFARMKLSDWTGRTPLSGSMQAIKPSPLGPILAPHHPVYVDLPRLTPHHNGYGFAWFNAARGRPSGGVPSNAILPSDVFAHMKFQGGRMSARGRWHAFETIEAGRKELSRTLVAWGREMFEAKRNDRGS